MIQPSQEDVKKDFDSYVTKATILIHAPETRDSILSLLNGNNPVQRVANATTMIMQRLDAAARESGTEVQDTVKCFAADEIVKLIVEVGTAAKKFKLDKDLVELALSATVQDYVKGEIKAGRIDPQKLSAQFEADRAKLPEEEQAYIAESLARIQQTAKKYNGGQGTAPGASAPTGLIAGGTQPGQE